jgi:LmbE family N-acetylglucosaminyl deacetylase
VLPLANGQEGFITSARIESQGDPLKILAVGAHPDDLEILCGGTLARYVAEGHSVVMCHATHGDRGSFEHSSTEIARIRDGEARRAAAIAGAEHATLGLSDGDVNAADPEQRRLVADLVREAGPDVIITHSPGDYMVDHNEISKLVFDASFLATLPLYETGNEPHPLVTPIFFMETIMGLGFAPTEYVDVSDHIETKVAMLEAHESQLTWLRDHDGIDILEQMKTATRFRGLQCGVRYAEGFVQSLTWLRGTTRRLLP